MPTSPCRIHRRRTKDWRKPPGAVYVGRGTKWGNPYRVVCGRAARPPGAGRHTRPGYDSLHPPRWAVVGPCVAYGLVCADVYAGFDDRGRAATLSTDLFRSHLRENPDLVSAARRELRGKDLMCWCPLDRPCHADVLLEIANEEEV